MTDHQRIHPVPDVEAPQPARSSAPLIPPNTAKSDAGDGGDRYFPPPPTRTHPVAYSPPPRKRSKRSCCCRVFCCLLSVVLLLIIAIAATVGILFLIFHPKIPKYSIDTLKITRFATGNDGSLSATFTVNITAHNPNKRIGIYYLGGSSLSAWYQDTLLCQGALPEFYQGHRNTTVVQVPLTGTVANAASLAASLQQQQQTTGNVPLVLKGRVPIKVKLGKLKLMKMRFKVRCQLTVDSLANNNEVRVGSSSCKIRLKRIF